MALKDQAPETPATRVLGTPEAGVVEEARGELPLMQVASRGELHLQLARAGSDEERIRRSPKGRNVRA